MNTTGRVKVAAAQVAPVFLDRDATVEKACAQIREAARNGAELIVFPEVFIPGYPDWVWVAPGNRRPLHIQLYAELLENSVTVPGDATAALGRAARESEICVAIGIHERNTEGSGRSLYNAILYIDSQGKIMGSHRKLVPTGMERVVWAPGDGSTLEVFDTPFGKLGGLICWENYMPLARQAMYSWGTQIYLAPTWDSSAGWLQSMQHVAREGGVFVISVCMALRMDQLPDRYDFKKLYPAGREWVNRGNSCIINPKGELIAGPVEKSEEILYAELDLGLVAKSKWLFDVAGHYARPDVFRFTVDREPRRLADDASGSEED